MGVRFGCHKLLLGRRVWVVAASIAIVAAGCGSSGSGHPQPAGPNGPTAAQLTEAKRLLDPDNEPQQPSAEQLRCVAQTVVQNPFLDQVANDMAQIPNKDLRQAVMTAYLQCAYNYVLDQYMRFAPANLSAIEKTCIRGKFTQLDINRFSEVIVEDPDAGYTGPLIIQACATNSPVNPLLTGTIPNMGGS